MALGTLSIGVKLDYSQALRDLGTLKVALDSVGKQSFGANFANGAKVAEKETANLTGDVGKVEKAATKADKTFKVFGKTLDDLGGNAIKKVGTGIADINRGISSGLGNIPLIGPVLGAPFNILATEAQGATEAITGLISEGASGLPGLAAFAAQTALIGTAVLSTTATIGPLVLAMAGALTVTTAFLGAVAGGLATVLGIVGGFALLTGGLFALDGALGINGPALTSVKDTLSEVGKTLIGAVSPALHDVATWLTAFKLQLDTFAKAWGGIFNSAMPALLNLAGYALKDILAVILQLSPLFVSWLNAISANAPTLNGLFNMLLQVGVQALVGLVTNGLKLVAWVTQLVNNRQAMSIVNDTLSAMGSIVQKVAGFVGEMVGWFVQNWPEISKLVRTVGDQFAYLWPLIQEAGAYLQSIWDQASQNKDFINGIKMLAQVVGTGLYLAIVIATGVMQQMFGMIQTLGSAGFWLSDTFSKVSGAIGSAFSAIGGSISGALSGAISTIDQFLSAIDNSPIGQWVNIALIPNPWGAGAGPGTFGQTGPMRFAKGGLVPGMGSGDTVPALLTPGEYVIPKGATSALGLGAGGGGGLASLIGSIGGQCLAWVSSVTGLFRGIPAAIELLGMINSHSPSPGEVFVMGSQVGPYGHTGFVTGASNGSVNVLDSNWNLDEVIRAHTVPSSLINGYIDIGSKAPGGLGIDVAGTIKGLLGKFAGSGLFGGLTNHILSAIASGAISKGASAIGSAVAGTVGSWDNGGGLQPGWNHVYNGTGAVENVQSPSERDATIKLLSEQNDLLRAQAKKLMGNVTITGAPQKTTGELLDEIQFQTWATAL